jgi:hypothetical protein
MLAACHIMKASSSGDEEMCVRLADDELRAAIPESTVALPL